MRSISNNRHFYVALTLYLTLSVVLLNIFRYELQPDGTVYFSIAVKYLNGDFVSAINPYWGPMLSWLLVPFISVGIEEFLASKIIFIAFGVLLMFGARLLSKTFEIRSDVQIAMWCALVPLVFFFTFHAITPDLILTSLLVIYIAILFSNRYLKSKWMSPACGAIGALAYFTKSFAFPFFIAHFLMTHVVMLAFDRKNVKSIANKAAIGLITFFVCSAPWITLISQEHESLTFGTSGSFVHAIEGPKYNFPPTSMGLVSPPDALSLSVWDDPTRTFNLHWNPLSSISDVIAQLKMIVLNSVDAIRVFSGLSVLSIAILMAAILMVIPLGRQKSHSKKITVLSLCTIALMVAAYLPVLILSRYLWVAWILILILGGNVCSALLDSNFFTPIRRKMLLTLFVLSFILTPVSTIVMQHHKGRDFRFDSIVLRETYELGGVKIASDKWKHGLYFAYHVRGRYYGQPVVIESATDLEAELLEHEIDYYALWGDVRGDLLSYRQVADTVVGGMRLRILERK